MVTTVTVIGLEFGAVLAGAVVVEIVFGWPGLGRLFYDAIYRRDFPLLTGSFMFSAAVVIVMNTASEIACALLDPRLRPTHERDRRDPAPLAAPEHALGRDHDRPVC